MRKISLVITLVIFSILLAVFSSEMERIYRQNQGEEKKVYRFLENSTKKLMQINKNIKNDNILFANIGQKLRHSAKVSLSRNMLNGASDRIKIFDRDCNLIAHAGRLKN